LFFEFVFVSRRSRSSEYKPLYFVNAISLILYQEKDNTVNNLPNIKPINDPIVQKMIECHSTAIFMKMIQNAPLAVPEMYFYLSNNQIKNITSVVKNINC
jgi:hypothetical protein